MRKIVKTCDLSTVYKEWEENLEKTGAQHPSYEHTTTRNKFYEDIKMQLLRCQDGVCAYTETLLASKQFFAQDKWKDGKTVVERSGVATLDHFDSTLKKDKAWLWDNFFLVREGVNTSKSTIKINPLLKPDRADYDPKKWFSYDEKTHCFIPKQSLNKEEKIMVDNGIRALGLNAPTVLALRSEALEARLSNLKIGAFVAANLNLTQFFTAMDFLIEIYTNEENKEPDFY